MSDFWDKVEPRVYESRIKVPYAWQAGETASRFLLSLRDRRKFIGKKCAKCGKVLVPPRKSCPYCFVPTGDWVDLSDEGVVETFTIVRRDTGIVPMKPPFAYAVIKLDGADTGLVHLLGEVEPGQIRAGMRVKAVFAKERSGKMLDVEYFKPL
jgi:uncharacterized OB-fold protein